MSFRSCMRWWSFGWMAFLVLGFVATSPSRGGNPPATDKPPDAEDILTEVVRQNSDQDALPPASSP